MSLIKDDPDFTVKQKAQALKDAIEILSGKWKMCILQALWSDTRRFTELQDAVTGISPKVLTKELLELESHHLVSRTVNNSRPVTVSYKLTQHACEVKKAVDALIVFGLTHRKEVIGKKSNK